MQGQIIVSINVIKDTLTQTRSKNEQKTLFVLASQTGPMKNAPSLNKRGIKIWLWHFIAVKNCGDPGSPANGFRVGSEFTYGAKVIFDCNPGFKLRGSIFRECQADGTWSGTAASCSGG